MNIVHLVVVKNSFYILESGRTIRKSAHFSLILGTKNLVKYWDSTAGRHTDRQTLQLEIQNVITEFSDIINYHNSNNNYPLITA